MCSVAVRADRGIAVAGRQLFGVDGIQSLLIKLVVTLLAESVHLEREITRVFGSDRRMGISGNVRVTRSAALTLLAVYGCVKAARVDG